VLATVLVLAVGVPPAFGTDHSGENGRIAFVSDRRTGEDLDIWSMRPDGSRQVNRTRNPAFDFDPDWQPVPKRHH
jgi:Tol biopolymer transport system component